MFGRWFVHDLFFSSNETLAEVKGSLGYVLIKETSACICGFVNRYFRIYLVGIVPCPTAARCWQHAFQYLQSRYLWMSVSVWGTMHRQFPGVVTSLELAWSADSPFPNRRREWVNEERLFGRPDYRVITMWRLATLGTVYSHLVIA